MRNRIGLLVCALVALAAMFTVLSDARASTRGGIFKEYITQVAKESGRSEAFVRERAIEELRQGARFNHGELERIGRGESLFFERELQLRRFLQESRTFSVKLGLGAVWNAAIRNEAGQAFDAMKDSMESSRLAEMAKSDPVRMLVEKTNLTWGEDNIMNDNGVLLSAREIEGEHGQATAVIEKDELFNLNEDLLRDAYSEREELEFPRKAKFESEMSRYSEKAVIKQLTIVGREGFDLDPQSLPKSLGDAVDGESILSSFKAIVAQLGINSANGAIVVSSVEVADVQGVPRHFTSLLFLNRKTNRLLSIFVRSV